MIKGRVRDALPFFEPVQPSMAPFKRFLSLLLSGSFQFLAVRIPVHSSEALLHPALKGRISSPFHREDGLKIYARSVEDLDSSLSGGRNCEGESMGRWLTNLFLILLGQDSSHLSAGKGSPSVLTKLCLLDESKKAFFVEPGGDEKDSGGNPAAKPAPRKIHPR
jgi:hypothetical protein